MNPNIQWITPGGTLGATAANPKVYADCNLAAPSSSGKEIIRRLQAYLQQQVPNSGVRQTGFLDAETCAAWQVSPVGRMLDGMGIKYPANFNVTNILDTLDGASTNAEGQIVHHWRCDGQRIPPDCSKIPSGRPATGGTKKTNWGPLLLGAAALTAGYFALS